MTTAEATSEVFWTAFRALPKKAREAVKEKMRRWQQKRLASECAKLSAKEERALSERN